MIKETIEEVAKRYAVNRRNKKNLTNREFDLCQKDFIVGAKFQAEQIPSIIEQYLETAFISKEQGYKNPKEWFEQFKKK